MCIDGHLNTETTQTCENGVMLMLLVFLCSVHIQVTEIRSKTPKKPLTIHYTKDVFSSDMEC